MTPWHASPAFNQRRAPIDMPSMRLLPVSSCFHVQDGPVWIQIHRLMGVSELVLKLMLQRQQRHEADMQELQRLRCRVAEPEDRACGS
jgi:hypothetical protein